MEPYAVIQTGGKQYRVQKGDVFDIEKLEANAGDALEITSVLAVSDGSSLKCGNPEIEGASVTLEVVDQFRGKKLVAFKKKRRKGYKRKIGHRQSLTKVKVIDVVG